MSKRKNRKVVDNILDSLSITIDDVICGVNILTEMMEKDIIHERVCGQWVDPYNPSFNLNIFRLEHGIYIMGVFDGYVPVGHEIILAERGELYIYNYEDDEKELVLHYENTGTVVLGSLGFFMRKDKLDELMTNLGVY